MNLTALLKNRKGVKLVELNEAETEQMLEAIGKELQSFFLRAERP